MIRLALYQPEIPQNTGTLLRLSACMGISLDIIDPCGFALSDAKLKRAGMDYLNRAIYKRHDDYQSFFKILEHNQRRLVLLTPHTNMAYTLFNYHENDTLLLGKESNGVPETLLKEIDNKVCIPMAPGERSLNIAVAASMVLGEALRQTNMFPTILKV